MRLLFVGLMIFSKFVHAELPSAAPSGPHRFPSLAGLEIEFLEGDLALGNQFGDVVAANLSVGTVLWRFESAKAVGLHDGLAVISSGQKLIALTLADGKAAWTYQHQRNVSEALLDGGLIIFSDEQDLTAVSLSTHARLWRSPLLISHNEYSMRIAAADGVVLTAESREALNVGEAAIEARERATGKRLWKFPTPTMAIELRALNGLVFAITSDGEELSQLLALELKTGKKRWQIDEPIANDPFNALVGARNGLLFVQTSRSLVAFEAASGRVRWKNPVPASDCLVDDELIVVGGGLANGPALEAFDVKTGKPRWTVQSAHPFGLRAWKGGLLTSLGRNPVAYLAAGVPPPAPVSRCEREFRSSEIGFEGEHDEVPARLARNGFPPSLVTGGSERLTSEIFYAADCKADALAIAKVLGLPESATKRREQKTGFGIVIVLGPSKRDAGVK